MFDIETCFDKEILKKKTKALLSETISIRRLLHENPELSGNEVKTAEYLKKLLSAIDGTEISELTPPSFMVTLKGSKPGPVLALRAEMDALPINEKRSDIPFVSKNKGIMHACGHDGHMATLVAVIKLLSEFRQNICGTVHAIFQSDEETMPGGASRIVKSGKLPKCGLIFALHYFSFLPLGKVQIHPGSYLAASDWYRFSVKGKGGHSASPEDCTDPLIIGANIVQQLQQIVSRRVDPRTPSVLSNTFLCSGSNDILNIIPSVLNGGGSVRTYGDETREKIKAGIENVIKSSCEAFGAKYDYNYIYGHPSVPNDEKAAAFASEICRLYLPGALKNLPLPMVGDDFSEYSASDSERLLYVSIGSGSENGGCHFPHHSPDYALDESVLETGIILSSALALNFGRYKF